MGEGQISLVDEVPDEPGAAYASVDAHAERGIERDGSLEQDGRDGLVMEAARAHERLVDYREVVTLASKSGSNGVEIIKR
jgi:hypothetical protein